MKKQNLILKVSIALGVIIVAGIAIYTGSGENFKGMLSYNFSGNTSGTMTTQNTLTPTKNIQRSCGDQTYGRLLQQGTPTNWTNFTTSSANNGIKFIVSKTIPNLTRYKLYIREHNTNKIVYAKWMIYESLTHSTSAYVTVTKPELTMLINNFKNTSFDWTVRAYDAPEKSTLTAYNDTAQLIDEYTCPGYNYGDNYSGFWNFTLPSEWKN